MSTWVQNNPLEAHVGMSEKGYSNNVIGLAWLKRFHADTLASAPNGEKRVLAVDGHGSHCTAEAIEFAREHNIEIIAYPPHTTHALQGLDMVLFSSFKRTYTKAVLQYEQEEDEHVTKDSFLTLLV
ncbi:hypothetical protein AURDEDRAFT_162311 [Auricularia subglabra TFB-10046 SS5]|nr:hypothetical protein AURDEDRAFT_162311 [Auricularia subglabra TFB-10046 SS5]